jgi:2,3-bisphosphoglycerate-independent phosphoglycerate mutase
MKNPSEISNGVKRILLIIIDGLGDKPIPELGDKTPLEGAKTPNLDFLAKNGICGLIDPYLLLGQDYPASDTCHLALFGYDPKVYYLGRGPYEAAGIGIKLREGDVALRVNFATVDENLKVIDRRAGRIEKTQPLIKVLSQIKIKGVKFILKKSYGHRAVLVLRGKNVSSAITDGDPKKVGEKAKKILPVCLGKCGIREVKKAKFTAKILNEFLNKAHQILKNHPSNKGRIKKGLLPANYLLVRGVGEIREIPKFKEKYGLKAGCIAAGSLYKGIGKILGMDLIKVKGANGFPNTNLRGKILAAKNALKKYNFIFCHIKATDSLAEDGNFFGKKEFIEKIDKNLKPLPNLKNVLIIVTADHSTCSELKRHCSEPIPILIYGAGRDSVKEFSEKACQKGKLGKFPQLKLMSKIFQYAEITNTRC